MTAPRCPACEQEYASEPCALHRSAPDLLAALRGIVRASSVATDPLASLVQVNQVARAAIARAERRDA